MSQGHAVIDGSNLATEGRNEPSLAQLDEAVRAIDAEYDFARITVIVDATFEHRVAPSESKAARKAIDENDIITPPAGVIGRGDAFILQVADRAKAVVFSNDSFQEFHGTYDWLFEEGRLVGGKPIPGVGWIYVTRSPVRGPVSRRATADSRKAPARKPATPAAAPKKQAARPRDEPKQRRPERTPRTAASPTGDGTNQPGPWKAFAADYPVGSTIAATVDRFSSHGAYSSVDDVVIYLPNRLLGSPAPTKARDVLDLGQTVDFIVHRYDADRYGIDAGLIAAPGSQSATTPSATTPRTSTKRPGTRTSVKKAARKAGSGTAAAPRSAPKKLVTKKAVAKKAPAKKAVTKKAVAKKAPAKKAVAKKAVAKKAAAKPAPVRNAPAKKAPNRR